MKTSLMCQLQLIRMLTFRNGENNIAAMNITSINLINKFQSVFRNQKCYSTDLDAAFCPLPMVDIKIVGKFSNLEEGKHTSSYEKLNLSLIINFKQSTVVTQEFTKLFGPEMLLRCEMYLMKLRDRLIHTHKMYPIYFNHIKMKSNFRMR